MEVWGVKLMVSIILIVEVLLCGLLPTRLLGSLRVTGSRNHIAISCLNCFGGGVFLGTAFLHLLPEVRMQMMNILEQLHIKTDFAVAEFVTAVGFFLVMILEHSVVKCKTTGDITGHEHSQNFESRNANIPEINETTPLISEKHKQEKAKDSSKTLFPCEQNTICRSPNLARRTIVQTCGAQEQPSNKSASPVPDVEADRVCVREDVHPPHLHSFRSIILFIALSLHTIFEGLAIGLQTKQADVWQLFIAICIHKGVVTLSLGLQISRHQKKFSKLVMYIVIFCLICPVGILIGTIVVQAGSDSFVTLVANGLLQGLATGTFFYVTFFEVLNREIGENHCLLRVLFALVGFSVIALLSLFGPAD